MIFLWLLTRVVLKLPFTKKKKKKKKKNEMLQKSFQKKFVMRIKSCYPFYSV